MTVDKEPIRGCKHSRIVRSIGLPMMNFAIDRFDHFHDPWGELGIGHYLVGHKIFPKLTSCQSPATFIFKIDEYQINYKYLGFLWYYY